MDPRGKVALITGGARVGRTVAEWLAARGCDVALTYRASRKSAEESAAAVRSQGVRALTVAADVADPAAAAATVAAVRDGLGRLDILVTMASVYEKTPLERLDDEALRRNLEADMLSVYRLALAAAPVMKTGGGGRIVAFGDWPPVSGRR